MSGAKISFAGIPVESARALEALQKRIEVVRQAAEALSETNLMAGKKYSRGYALGICAGMGEPSGFENYDSDNNVAMNNATREFSITPYPTSGAFSIWINGKNYRKNLETLSITNTEGNHYIYYDANAELQEIVNPTNAQIRDLIKHQVIAGYVYWDNDSNVAVITSGEQHGTQMDGSTHAYQHFIHRTAYKNGLALSNITSDAAGDNDAHAQFTVDSGEILDEDLLHSIPESTTEITVYYNSGANVYLRRATQTGFAVLNAPLGRLYYNNPTGWTLEEVTNNQFVLYHIFAMNDHTTPLISVMGQAIYATINTARAGADTEINRLITSFPAPEFKIIATIIFQTADSYTNAVKARIRKTADGADYIDWRFANLTPGTTVTDHRLLSNLTNGDAGHTQFALLSGAVFSGDIKTNTGVSIYPVTSGGGSIGAGTLPYAYMYLMRDGFISFGYESGTYAQIGYDVTKDAIKIYNGNFYTTGTIYSDNVINSASNIYGYNINSANNVWAINVYSTHINAQEIYAQDLINAKGNVYGYNINSAQNVWASNVFSKRVTCGIGNGLDLADAVFHARARDFSNAATIERMRDETTGVYGALRVLTTSSGDMTDGFGTGVAWCIRDNAGVVNPIAAIYAKRAGNDTSGNLVFYTYATGSGVQRFEMGNTGNFNAASNIYSSNMCAASNVKSQTIEATVNVWAQNQIVPAIIYKMTAKADVANTAIETQIHGTGIGNLVLPANYLRVGRGIRVKAYGVWGTKSGAPGTFDLSFKMGTTNVVSLEQHTPTSNVANPYYGKFEYEMFATCNAAGSVGSVYAFSRMITMIGPSPASPSLIFGWPPPVTSGGGVQIDTTQEITLNIAAKFSTANVANFFNCRSMVIEALN